MAEHTFFNINVTFLDYDSQSNSQRTHTLMLIFDESWKLIFTPECMKSEWSFYSEANPSVVKVCSCAVFVDTLTTVTGFHRSPNPQYLAF